MQISQASAAIGLNATAEATSPLAVGSVNIGVSVSPIAMMGTNVVYGLEVEMLAGDTITLVPTTGVITGTPTSFAKTISISGTLTEDGVLPLTPQAMSVGSMVNSKLSFSSFVAAGTAYNACDWNDTDSQWSFRFYDSAGDLIAEYRADDDTDTPVGATFTARRLYVDVSGTLNDGSAAVTFPRLLRAPDDSGKEAFSEDGESVGQSPLWSVNWGTDRWYANSPTALWENTSSSSTVPLTGWTPVSPATGTPTLEVTAATGTPVFTAATTSSGVVGGAGKDFEGNDLPTMTVTGILIEHVSGPGTVTADGTTEAVIVAPKNFAIKAARPETDGTANTITSPDIDFTTTQHSKIRVAVLGVQTV